MLGFTKGEKPKSKNASGGKVVGPGTGVSDDVKTTVPEGSYIMPADSTAQIGEQNLAGMGKDVPVNLSNGEYQLPPDQVHAVGVQALEQMKNATHTPAAMQGAGFKPGMGADGKPELFFADGGPVFSNVDPDELGRNNTPDRTVKPQAPRMYVDGAGNATKDLPSQSRAVVPAGQRIDYSNSRQLVPGAKPNTLPATVPQAAPQGRPDFYTNRAGQTAAGFMPSSSRAVVPIPPGPAPAPLALPAPQPAAPASQPYTPDYRARAQVMQNIARDTAAWNAERAAQDARFSGPQPAGQPAGQPSGFRSRLPQKLGVGGGAGALLTAVPEAIDVARVAQSENTTKADVATQAAEGLGRWGAATAGASLGAQGGAALGAFGGPFAPVTVPVGGVIGGLLGGATGYFGADKAIEYGREITGVSTESPIDRVNAEPPRMPYPAPVEPGATVAQQAPAATETQASSQPAAAPASPAASGELANNVIREGNSFSASGPIRPGFTVNGQPTGPINTIPSLRSPQNEAAVQALMARTPEFGQGVGARQQRAEGFRPRVTVVGNSDNDRASEKLRREIYRAATTKQPGARGLTANQLRTLAGLQESSERNATDLAREQMQQAGADGRAAITEAGANQRFAQSNALDQQRTAAEVESKGFANRSAQRIEKLYEQYEKAAPEDRAAIAEQLRVLTGKDKPDQYGTVNLGTEVDPVTGMVTNRGDAVFNRANGQIIGQSTALPPIEQNPQALAIKNNQNLSRDERAKQLRALGYQ